MSRRTMVVAFLFLVGCVSVTAQSLSGTYRLVQDSTGKQPKAGAAVEIAFKGNGTFTIKAVMPGETVDDTGTYKIVGRTLTIDFKELEQGHQSGVYSLSGDTLTLPFKMFSEGAGSSRWRAVPGQGAPASTVKAGPAASPGSLQEVLARTLRDAQGSDNARQRGEMDQRASSRAAAYRGGAAQAYYVQATILFLKRYHKEAWYGFAKASNLQPQNGVYLNNLAMVLMELGRYGDAKSILEWVVKNYPNLDSPWGNLGASCLKTGENDCALSAFQRAMALAPENGLYAYGVGKALEAKGRKDEAQRYFGVAWQNGYGGSGKEGASAAGGSGSGGPGGVRGSGAGSVGGTGAQGGRGNQGGRGSSGSSGPGRRDRIPAEWVGHYEARYVRATSGMDRDRTTTFGKGMTQTTMDLQTMACVQQFSMEVSASGSIQGRGRIMYVYQGKAANPSMMLMPGMAAAGAGGFAANLKDGKQFRDWSFSGQVSPDGAVEINGIPDEPMDLLNVGKWEKHKPWSPLPPDGPGKAMRGPFHMTLASERGGPPAIRVDQFLALGDALIKRVHYQAVILKSDSPVTPDCKYSEPAKPKCAASEYLKAKGTIGVDGIYTIEASKDMKTGETGVTSKVGGGEPSRGGGMDSSGNISFDGAWGNAVGSVQFNPTDGSYSMSMGMGIDTSSVVPGPVKVSEKIELVYDSLCGWGIKGTAGVTAGAAAAGVEGCIYFNKGL